MCSSYIRWIVSIGCIVLRTSRCGSTKKALSRVQEKQKVRCPRGCHVPLHAHRVVHTHINRYVQGTALSPHYDLEGPERAPWPHCSRRCSSSFRTAAGLAVASCASRRSRETESEFRTAGTVTAWALNCTMGGTVCGWRAIGCRTVSPEWSMAFGIRYACVSSVPVQSDV